MCAASSGMCCKAASNLRPRPGQRDRQGYGRLATIIVMATIIVVATVIVMATAAAAAIDTISAVPLMKACDHI